MPSDGFTIKSRIRNLLRSPSTKHKKKMKESLSSKVTLEKVLGVTTSGNSGLACDPRSGLVAYPAGCVVVLLYAKKNRQHHIINTSRKTITALSFSPDGKHLVTGESGHLPAVRLWDVAERRQVAELQKHKYGVSCVAFSPNSKYIVSVGNQHDMMVNVWAWKKDVVVAANKVSSKVTGVSFSEDSSYFVTVGNRHVKFWYMDHCKASKASTPVPLLGRSGLLGELRNNFFCDVACGRGSASDSTFCITFSGLLCEFNCNRMLDKWVDLRTGMAQSLSMSEDMIFCGCADGTVRAFRPVDLHFVCTLPRPHPLGTDVSAITEASHLFSTKTDARYPDAIAVTYDPVSQWLSCVYNDHSVYVWDVRDVNRVGKVHSALFHAACVGDLEMFPDVPGEFAAGLSSGAFLSCSADNTIRLWRMSDGTQTLVHSQNILSSDLLNIIYIDRNTSALLDPECLINMNADKPGDGQPAESRTGIRTICVSPDGKHLASGDRNGMLRVHDLSSMEEILKVDAHDAEILCLEYSKPETGLKLLATASRDRLIHVLDAEDDYSLVQTLDEHSSSITAIRFAANDNKVKMISCGADKSIYFRTAHKTDRGTEFRRSHHMVRKTTLYDMSVDPTCTYAAVGCQDRCIRIFNISSGKQKKLYKGSLSEDGSLLRVQLDPSGQYIATSCSDKNISLFDFYTGECVATMDGHSELVTGLKFTNDCKHLISASGDSCIFVWQLAPELTISMRERLCQLRKNPSTPSCKTPSLRRDVYSAPTLAGLSSDSENEEEDGAETDDPEDIADIADNTSSDSSHAEEDTGGSDEGQEDWELTKHEVVNQVTPDSSRRPRRRWSHRLGTQELKVKSMLDLRQLETFGPKKNPNCPPHDRDRRSTSSQQEPNLQLEERAKRSRRWPHAAWMSSHPSKDIRGTDGVVLYPKESEGDESLQGSDYMVKEQRCSMQGRGIRSESKESRSPDSACSLGYDSRDSSPDSVPDVEFMSQDSSDEENEERDGEEQKAEMTSMDEALRRVTDTVDRGQEDFHKQNFETLEESCSLAEQSRVPRLSMSSRFLARGHNNRSMSLFAKVQGKEQGSHSAKPPVSKVRPLMEDSQSRSTEDNAPVSPGRNEGPDRADASDGALIFRPLKRRKTSGSQLWRMSNPPSKASLLLDTCIQKSHSAQNLASDSPHSPVPSGDQMELRKRLQELFLDQDSPKPSFHFSSPSSGSPQTPRSPLPWESPKLKHFHSYMNPTASSMAKSSRSTSLGDVVQAGTPPCSPSLPRGRRLCGELGVEPPLLTSSPATTFSYNVSSASSLLTCPLPNSPSPTPPPRTDRDPPSPITQNLPPSRIPLPKQPLSPRRSLCLDVMPMRASALTADPGCDLTPTPGNRALGKKLSLSLDPSLPSLLPVRQKRDSVSESGRDPLQVAVAKEYHLVPEYARTSSADPQPDHSITLETCRQAATELHNSLRRTAMLYTMVLQCDQQPCEDQQEMRGILSDALFTVKAELHSLPRPTQQVEGPKVDQGVKGDGDKALALLEQYAELLLKSVERRLDTKT
ncbi:LOW QUALITY PROTEIN: mitogen-activated protein kinase-binding protein 1-like [Cottoperca gobio]|uniref:LOW QUALITY PROTEIN: mitogen-activated protein kinase-binding protein 1-like n=1 Tax=Cottoperca gobio TaxID=56716 RepID=A0A6J2P9C2_COTGO|nr:LOW QUALITY PROTEIN: mitogen-activated protein kinase-binding protein 1-like [Cottoperca gobio]